jgi:hypothetical protein
MPKEKEKFEDFWTADFWEYCSAIQDRMDTTPEPILEDMPAVIRAHDCQWTVDEAVETLRERRHALQQF